MLLEVTSMVARLFLAMRRTAEPSPELTCDATVLPCDMARPSSVLGSLGVVSQQGEKKLALMASWTPYVDMNVPVVWPKVSSELVPLEGVVMKETLVLLKSTRAVMTCWIVGSEASASPVARSMP